MTLGGMDKKVASPFLSGGMIVSVCLSNFRSGDSIIAGPQRVDPSTSGYRVIV